jgi:lipoprotein NlpD
MGQRVRPSHRWGPALASVVLLALLAGCAAPTPPARRAPVVDRSPVPAPAKTPPASAAAGVASASAPVVGLPPGAENAGRPGYYTVRPGDTLIRIGLDTGQNWRDLQAWNGLSDPNRIEVGQVLRVVPPVGEASVAAIAVSPSTTAGSNAPVSTSAVNTGTVQGRSLDTPAGGGTGSSGASTPPIAVAATASAAVAPRPAAAAASDEVAFVWPANGPVVDPFDESRNKGVGIGGKAGEPVLAAADGRVVYAGAGLRGYGNLVILKHNNTYLTAYAHNQTLLVREDQTVRQGQKIAEMGSSDSDRVKLHFEVRRQGKPVDPLKHLPSR